MNTFIINASFLAKALLTLALIAFSYSTLPLTASAQYYSTFDYDEYYDDLIYDKEPSVWSVTPSTARQGEEVVVRGSFGTEQGRVTIGNKTAKITLWTSSSIYVIVPADLKEGKTNITVSNKRGSKESLQIYVEEGPVITKVYPTDVVPGITEIGIQGRNFGNSRTWTDNPDTEIYIGNLRVESAAWSDTYISFTVPENITKSGRIEITIDGLKMSPIQFTVKGAQSAKDKKKSSKSKDKTTATTSSTPNDPMFSKQYYFKQLNVLDGWKHQGRADGITVAVIDDGVYVNHPDLKSSIWKNPKEVVGNGIDDDKNGYIDDIYGWDFVSEEAEMSTRGTHGTAVAGIIAAQSNNGIGISGMAPGAKIMPLIACDSRTGCATADVVAAINYAVKNGAKVINLSLGSQGTTNYTNQYDAAINSARQAGVIVIAAAGNGDTEGGNGQNLTQIPVSPVCNGIDKFSIIGVAGLDEQSEWVSWSNYGGCVDVAAPAIKIVTTTNPNHNDGYEYGYEDGTSFAAPMASALAALMIAQKPTITVSELVTVMRADAYNDKNYQKLLGGGRIDFAETLKP